MLSHCCKYVALLLAPSMSIQRLLCKGRAGKGAAHIIVICQLFPSLLGTATARNRMPHCILSRASICRPPQMSEAMQVHHVTRAAHGTRARNPRIHRAQAQFSFLHLPRSDWQTPNAYFDQKAQAKGYGCVTSSLCVCCKLFVQV